MWYNLIEVKTMKFFSFFSFFRLLMELANFSAPSIFGLLLIQADFYAITITNFPLLFHLSLIERHFI